MPHRRPKGQQNFKCDFCPTRNSWVRYIKAGEQKHLICPECIAELAKQVRAERALTDANKTRLPEPEPDVSSDPAGGIRHIPL